MKSQIKKILCLALSTVFIVSALLIGASAQTKHVSIDRNLVTYWDFEGDTPLSDKAPATTISANNKNADALVASADGVTIENGIAKIDNTKDGYLWLNNADFSVFDGRVLPDSTIYTKFRFSGDNTGYAYILEIPGIFRLYRHSTNDRIAIQWYYQSVGTNYTMDLGDGFKIAADTDYYFAFSTRTVENSANKNADGVSSTILKCNFYLSTDGVTYTVKSLEYDLGFDTNDRTNNKFGGGRSTAAAEGGGVYIGSGNKDKNLTFEFDEVRFYKGAFGTPQVKQISAPDGMTPIIVGCQNLATVADGQTQSVRLLTTLESYDYKEAGYNVEINYDGLDTPVSFSEKCTTVYTGLTANEGGTIEQITAAALNGKYIMPLTLEGIPCWADKTITLTVSAYGIDMNGVTHISVPVLITISNGIVKSIAYK